MLLTQLHAYLDYADRFYYCRFRSAFSVNLFGLYAHIPREILGGDRLCRHLIGYNSLFSLVC